VVKLALGDSFHRLSDVIVVCVGVDFGKACYIYIDSCHGVTYVWPFAAVFIPSQAVQVLEVYASDVWVWSFLEDVSSVFIGLNCDICGVFKLIEYCRFRGYHSIFLPVFAPGGGVGTSSSISISCCDVGGGVSRWWIT